MPDLRYRVETCGEGGVVCAGVDRAPSRPRHHRLAIAAAASTHRRVGDELVGEYVDDGHSGARLDRPGLDALRDAAEAGLIERVWCLSPDRLARAYAYQVLVLDELDRFGVVVAFTDSPGLAADDPQSVLLTQVQGVIAEYEKAKIAERYRRGKLFRARAGEIVTWKAPYGIGASPAAPPPAKRITRSTSPRPRWCGGSFTDRAAGISVREICRRLNADAIPSPTGKPTWGTSTLCRLLRNEAYIGRVYYNRTESVPDRRPTRRHRQVPRDPGEWIPIDCPRIVSDELFQPPAASPSTTPSGAPAAPNPANGCSKALSNAVFAVSVLGATRCAAATAPGTATTTAATTTPSALAENPAAAPNATSAPMPSTPSCSTTSAPPSPAPTSCSPANKRHPDNPDPRRRTPLRRTGPAGPQARCRRCRTAPPTRPLSGRPDRLPELQRRATEVAARRKELQHKRTSLAEERAALARDNQLRSRVHDFAARVHAIIDNLDDTQKQQLLRLLIEDVRVTGWHVQIRLRIALDPPPRNHLTQRPTKPDGPNRQTSATTAPSVNPRRFAFH